MRVVLKLELIGDNYYAAKREAPDSQKYRARYAEMLGRDKSRPWVARLTDLDPVYGFKREFVKGQKDYSLANSIGSRGVYVYYPLKSGLYEVHERLTWKRTRRYFIRVQDAKITEIAREEVLRCLANATSA